MQMPVIVGVIISLMFLITFSEWFYNLISGWNEYLLKDMFLNYRVIGAGLASVLLFVGAFWVFSLVNECKEEEREGLFAKLNCSEYSTLMTTTEQFFQKGNKTID